MMNFQSEAFLVTLFVTCFVGDSICKVSNGTKCPGPVKHYKALRCKPIFKNFHDQCAAAYDCAHLKNRQINQCLVNGQTYDIGERLKPEDANPCDKECICYMRNGMAQFSCTIVNCPSVPLKPDCYLRRDVNKCCRDSVPICQNRPTCMVTEKEVYKDGEYFTVENKHCYCGPNFRRGNFDSFCRIPKQDPCNLELRHSFEIMNNYPPIFYDYQSAETECGIDFRYQNPRDAIIKHNGAVVSNSTDLKCFFGNMTLEVGESLVPATDYDSVCIDCKCEVPPILTCYLRSEMKCDRTNHEDFSKYHRIST